jgi:hypothetical protein
LISPAATAGVGRINSATAAATTDRQSDGRGLGFGRAREEERGMELVEPNRAGRFDLTTGPP